MWIQLAKSVQSFFTCPKRCYTWPAVCSLSTWVNILFLSSCIAAQQHFHSHTISYDTFIIMSFWMILIIPVSSFNSKLKKKNVDISVIMYYNFTYIHPRWHTKLRKCLTFLSIIQCQISVTHCNHSDFYNFYIFIPVYIQNWENVPTFFSIIQCQFFTHSLQPFWFWQVYKSMLNTKPFKASEIITTSTHLE